MKPFRVCLFNYFYSLEIYDSIGKEIFSLEEAAQEAERQYPGPEGWKEVYNGEEGISREEWSLREGGSNQMDFR